MSSETYKTLTITLTGISPPQAIGLRKFFESMVALGNVGSSRWVAFFSDGGGNFRPELTRFEYPDELPDVPEVEVVGITTGILEGVHIRGIGYDIITWRMNKRQEGIE